jgi:hypothetical protein
MRLRDSRSPSNSRHFHSTHDEAPRMSGGFTVPAAVLHGIRTRGVRLWGHQDPSGTSCAYVYARGGFNRVRDLILVTLERHSPILLTIPRPRRSRPSSGCSGSSRRQSAPGSPGVLTCAAPYAASASARRKCGSSQPYPASARMCCVAIVSSPRTRTRTH